jgi:hypothetical protein
MADDYYELANVVELADAEALIIPRTRLLHDAVARQRDFAIVRLLQHSEGDAPKLECLIVDVECDGVPSKNGAGVTLRRKGARHFRHNGASRCRLIWCSNGP